MLVGITLAASACGADAADEGDPAGLIAYDAYGSSYDVYVVNADGTRERRLTDNEFAEYDPALSPDGTTIVFVVEAFGRGPELVVMGSDRSGRRKLIRETSPWWHQDPVWSPDGREIAFGTATGMHIASSDGTGVRRVTRVEGDGDATWSPAPRSSRSCVTPPSTSSGSTAAGSDG
jgi:Tol biopolymer transport system component